MLIGDSIYLDTSRITLWSLSGNYLYENPTANVGIGTITPHGKLEVASNGTNTSDTAAVVFSNNTPAVNGTQQPSHGIRLSGYGWGTTAGTSQRVDWWINQSIVQGTVPSTSLLFQKQINGGSYATAMTLANAGI